MKQSYSGGPLYPQKLLADHKPRRRKCLGGCDREFNSKGPANRICPRCVAAQKPTSRRES